MDDGWTFLPVKAAARNVLTELSARTTAAEDENKWSTAGVVIMLGPFPEAFVAVREAIRHLLTQEMLKQVEVSP